MCEFSISTFISSTLKKNKKLFGNYTLEHKIDIKYPNYTSSYKSLV